MRNLLLALALLMAAPAWVAAQTCSDPTDKNVVNVNPVYVPPIVPTTGFNRWVYRVGGTSSCATDYGSLGSACSAVCAGSNWDTGPIIEQWTGSNWTYSCTCTLGGSQVFVGAIGSGLCSNVAPAGYKTWNSWKSKAVDDMDVKWTADGGVPTRNSDGNLTSLQLPDGSGGTLQWTANTWDSHKRVTQVTLPDSTNVTYTYYPTNTRVYTRTDSLGTTYYTWMNDTQPNVIQTPDGTNFQFIYNTDAEGGLHLKKVGVSKGACNTARAGQLATCGADVTYVSVNESNTKFARLMGVDYPELEHYDPVGIRPFLYPAEADGTLVIAYGADIQSASPVYPLGDPTLPLSEEVKGGCKDPGIQIAANGCQYAYAYCHWAEPGISIAPSTMAEWMKFRLCMISFGCFGNNGVGSGRR